MVGGRDYADSQFNRAVAAKRQPGSSFKPFVYLAALEKGLTPDTVREDAPISVKGWRPENYSREYFGPVTLTKALSLSLNTVAVRVGLEVGPKTVVAVRIGSGSHRSSSPVPSIALGASEVTPLEMASAYAAFANGGIGVQPHVITKVRTADGKLIYARRNASFGRVVDPQYVAMMNDMMQETLLTGTARKAELPGWQAAGKTAQSGFPRRLVRRLHQPPRRRGLARQRRRQPDQKVSGGNLPVDIWSRFMREALDGVPVAALPGANWRNGGGDPIRSPRFCRPSIFPAPPRKGRSRPRAAAAAAGRPASRSRPRRLPRRRPWPAPEPPPPRVAPIPPASIPNRRPRRDGGPTTSSTGFREALARAQLIYR